MERLEESPQEYKQELKKAFQKEDYERIEELMEGLWLLYYSVYEVKEKVYNLI